MSYIILFSREPKAATLQITPLLYQRTSSRITLNQILINIVHALNTSDIEQDVEVR